MTSTNPIRVAVGRVGGLTTHSRHDSNAIAANARTGLEARFEREVVEHAAAQGETLTPGELARRAECARRAFYARLALKSALARRKTGSGAA